MPWKEISPMDQKIQMIGDYLSEEYSISQLSKMYEVSRKTVYKWIGRYQTEGPPGLEERLKAPRTHPNATPLAVAREVVAVKLRHQRWGPKKILAWLEGHRPGELWPAASTVGEILKKEGLVKPRRKKHRTPPYSERLGKWERPNEVWSADFKGQFRTADGKLCYPLTIIDNSSRYVLLCRGLNRPTFEEAQPWFEWVFLEYGLPEAIRTDNGAPFASVGLGALTRLSIWLIKLGIRPERIEPGHPEQNGRQERMHRSLKEAVAKPPRSDIKEQQKAFDQFIQEYNFERPHEALGQKTPAAYYRPSLRPYPVRIPKIGYPGDVIVRQVRHNGEIRWKGELIYLSQALAGESVALKQKEEHLWEVRFSFHLLGVLNELTGEITPPPTKQRREVLPMCPV
jgi:transposase InsO family protein